MIVGKWEVQEPEGMLRNRARKAVESQGERRGWRGDGRRGARRSRPRRNPWPLRAWAGGAWAGGGKRRRRQRRRGGGARRHGPRRGPLQRELTTQRRCDCWVPNSCARTSSPTSLTVISPPEALEPRPPRRRPLVLEDVLRRPRT